MGMLRHTYMNKYEQINATNATNEEEKNRRGRKTRQTYKLTYEQRN